MACLWTQKQAAVSPFEKHATHCDELTPIARDCEELAAAMGFRYLYHRRRKVLSVGFDTVTQRPEESAYDLACVGIPDRFVCGNRKGRYAGTKRQSAEMLVISPCSTFLALAVDPRGAGANLRRMSELGWQGKYGFCEAVDYARAGGQGHEMVDGASSWHEPRVLATELPLHERLPSMVIVEPEVAESAAV
ncbi:MAG: hypothetical protein SGI92_01450 [Bryobacteraceae bacterium]|nr:hypothetical protein [Bryobacteraceae bacterium]